MAEHDRFTFFVAVAFSLLGVSAGQSCKTPEAIIVMREGEPCLSLPPPALKPVDYYVGQAEYFHLHDTDAGLAPVCPTAFTTCLDGKNADALGDNLAAYKRWAASAWSRCGPLADAGQWR